MPFQQLRGPPYYKAVHREICVPVAVPHSCTLLLKRPAQLCGEVMCQHRAVCGSMRASLPYDPLFRFSRLLSVHTCHFFANVLSSISEGGEIMSDSPRHFTSHDALETYFLIDCLRHQIERKSRLLKRDRFLLRKIDHLTGRLSIIYPEMHFVNGSSHSDQPERLAH